MVTYTFTFTIEVTDPGALIEAAQLVAHQGGEVDPDEIQTVEQALGWLFDNKPSPPGCSIQDSIAEFYADHYGYSKTPCAAWRDEMTEWTEADYVSVPKSEKYVRPEFRGRPGERMILLRRQASLLASGGQIDLERGYIKGGDRICTLLPDGTLPLSPAELKIVRERRASLPVKDQTP